ncbi:uncharacterized protein [Amphiura filiformis]|uniref:uncharacterized protein n=1 Tax=Amphiura filiformis TaxID=82378 RepID=UPI003B2254FB
MICGFKTLALTACVLWICAITQTGDALECVECSWSRVKSVAGFDWGASGEGDADCLTNPDGQSTVNCTAGAGEEARCLTLNINIKTSVIGIETVTKTEERKCLVAATADDPGEGCLVDPTEKVTLGEYLSGLDTISVTGDMCACSDEDLCNSAISVQSTMLSIVLVAIVGSFIKHL